MVFVLASPLVLNSCSYIPWIGEEDEEELAFEEDFPFEEEESFEGGREGEFDEFAAEDDFFSEEGELGLGEETGFDDGFASIDQRTDRNELRGDVESLQSQQEALISKVRELEEILRTLEPKIQAAQDRLEGGLSSASGKSDYLEPEVEELKLQVARLNDDIAQLKVRKAQTQRMPARRMSKPRMRKAVRTPADYDKALSAYRAGNYDESILLFQNLALGSPPESLKDNIVYWIGSNYVKLEMFDDAISQFETVLNKYPRGNKVPDSRYMLGVSYYKKGESSRAVEILQAALKTNPPMEVRGKILKQLNEIQ
ncbi:MAG: tetratricopeptide repeat protein [Nitrospinaceae bacterium]